MAISLLIRIFLLFTVFSLQGHFGECATLNTNIAGENDKDQFDQTGTDSLRDLFKDTFTDALIESVNHIRNVNQPRLMKHIRPGDSDSKKPEKRVKLPNEAALRDALGLDPSFYTLEWQWARKMCNGNQKARLTQMFMGVPVYGANIVAEQDPYTKEYYEDSIDAVWYSGIENDIRDTSRKISQQEAINLFKKSNGHNKYIHQNAKTKLWIYFKETLCKATMSYRVGYFLGVENNNITHSAYGRPAINKFPSRPIGFVDAATREVYESWNGLAEVQRPFKVTGITGNTETRQKMEEFFVLKESTNNDCFYSKSIAPGKILTLHDYRKSSVSVAQFQCPDAAKTTYDPKNGAFSPMNSAFKYASETVTLFLSTLDTTPTSGNLRILSHYPGFGAAWTGSEVYVTDGDDRTFYPFDQTDIIGHEVAHAFTESQSGLELTGQQGGINEGYSDMAGMALLDKLYNQRPFEIGQTTTKGNLPLRDLCNPPRVGGGIDNASKLTASTSIHAASGVYTKVFCLLSKNPNWNLQQVFKVFTYANSVYWKPRSNFATAACGVQSAAADLGTNVQDVTQAFAAVGVTCVPG